MTDEGVKRNVEKAKDVYRKVRVKAVSARYGNPASNLKVIAVTGTNGKTTTTCFINEILKEAGLKTALFSSVFIEIAGRTERNELNMTVGSVAQVQAFFREAKKARVDYVILEVTSHALHQHKLSGVPIVAAVMTNLSQDHLDYHGSMEAYAEVKSRLFSIAPEFIVLNRDDEWFDYFDQFPAAAQKITYGKHDEAEAKIERVQLYRKGTEVDIMIDHQTKLELATALPGEYNAYNMAAAASLAYVLGIDLEAIQEGVANLESIPGRFERVAPETGIDIVVDYAHTPDALEKLLTGVRAITKGRVILVFGATGERDKTKRPLMGEIAAKYADRILLTDEENYTEDPEAIRSMLREGIVQGRGDAKTTELPDRREAIERALSIAKKGDTVLITGLGHERYRILNGERVAWSDVDVVKDAAIKLLSDR